MQFVSDFIWNIGRELYRKTMAQSRHFFIFANIFSANEREKKRFCDLLSKYFNISFILFTGVQCIWHRSAKYQQLNNTNIPINFNTRVSINDVNRYNANEDSEKMHK